MNLYPYVVDIFTSKAARGCYNFWNLGTIFVRAAAIAIGTSFVLIAAAFHTAVYFRPKQRQVQMSVALENAHL